MARNKFPETKEFGSQIKKTMKMYNTKKNKDILRDVKDKLEVINIEVQDQIVINKKFHQEIEDTKKITDQILIEAETFRRRTSELHREAWWINKKYQILIAGSIALCLILAILFTLKLVL